MCDQAAVGWVCDHWDGCVNSRMGVLPVGWVCDK